MNPLKWLLVVVAGTGLCFAASATGFFYAVDRSVANTEFVSRWLTKQNLVSVAASAEELHADKLSAAEASLLSRTGISLIEPEIKKQAKPMLDPFFDFLKGKRNEPRLALDLNGLKQDPALAKRAADIVRSNETMKYLPSPVVESAAKLLLEKLPGEIDFLKILHISASDLTHLRFVTDKFYGYYHTALGFSLFFAALILFLLRDKRKIALTLGISLLVAGLLLFIPYMGSEMLATKMFSRYKGVAPEVVKAFSVSLIRDFFGVYVLSPVILSLAGLTGLITGLFVFKKTA